jgi:hypothetical protein
MLIYIVHITQTDSSMLFLVKFNMAFKAIHKNIKQQISPKLQLIIIQSQLKGIEN